MALDVSRPKSFILVFTDAPPKDVQKIDDVIDLVQTTQSKVIFVLTKGCNDNDPRFEVYHQIAITSKGAVFPLKDKFLIKPLLNFIHFSLQSHHVSLLYKAGVVGSAVFFVHVDSCLRDLLITVTSEDREREIAGVDVYSSSGMRYDEKIVNVKTARVVKVESLVTGRWSVNVSAEGTYTIQIGGLSDCDFDPAFVYSLTPSSLYRRPAAGTVTYMIMNATRPSYQTHDEYLCNCTGAHVSNISLLRLNGDEIYGFLIDWEVQQYFQVNANVSFRAPTEPFLIKTSGKDENRFPFQRISRTMVPGSAGPPVYINIENTEFWETEGNPLVLPCPYRTIASVKISWNMDGSVLSDGSRYVTNSDGRLLILSTTQSDAGLYQCRISSSVGNTSGQLLEVNIATYPVILGPRDVWAESGSKAQFICKVKGIPRPIVSWLFDGKIVTSNKAGDSRLTVSDLRPSDTGQVICIATNRAGKTNKTAMLIVGSTPLILLNGPKDQTVLVSQTVTMQCIVGGNPKPRIVWKHNGVTLKTKTNNRRLVNGGEMLVIQNTRLSDHGTYRCIGRNEMGKVKVDAFLTVIDPPRVILEVSDVSGILHQTISLVAYVSGHPVPSVMWYKDGNYLPADNRSIVHDNGTLTIQDIRLSDVGNYTLMASNDGGNDTATVHLTVTYAPYFVSTPANLSVIAGKRVVLECLGNGIPIPRITWIKVVDGIPQHIAGNGNRLIINTVQPSDAGIYACTLHNVIGQVTASAHLRIVLPVPPTIIATTVVVPIHSTARLHCIATGIPMPKITWFKDSSALISDPYKLSVLANGSLFIYNTTETDVGYYQCVTVNDGGHINATIYLDVHSPPHFTSVPTSTTLLNGSHLEWCCEAVGNPKPSISWFKNGEKLESDPDTYIVIKNGGTRLTLTSVNPSQSGQYTCKANNSMREESTVAVLFVTVPPRIMTTVRHVSSLLHSKALVPCESEGIPEPRVEWRMKGQPLDNLDKYVIFDNGTLLIHSLLESDGSVYECRAVNMAGNISEHFTLNIHVPATITTELVKHEVDLGRNLSLICSVIGNPRPSVTWYKDSVPIESTAEIELKNGNTILDIGKIDQHHAGQYTCQAVNVVTDMWTQKTLSAQSSSEVIVLGT
jgi:hemicentin